MSKNCSICGAVLPDNAVFCNQCGASLQETAEQKTPPKGKDGVYRWVAELPMMKCFFLLFEVWRVLVISAGIVTLFLAIINLLSGDGLDGVIGVIGPGLLVLAIMMVLSLPAYWIVADENSGKYTVLFEMNDEGINHTQIKEGKTKALEVLAALLGKKIGNYVLAGASALAATGASLYSRFSDVRKIQADRSRFLIQLKGKLIRNQVYPDPEHYDFVLDYIISHCPQAEIRKK